MRVHRFTSLPASDRSHIFGGIARGAECEQEGAIEVPRVAFDDFVGYAQEREQRSDDDRQRNESAAPLPRRRSQRAVLSG